MKNKGKLETKLKGTSFMLVVFVLQIILNIGLIFYTLLPLISAIINKYDVGVIFIVVTILTSLLSLIDTVLIGFTYKGFTKGLKGWALFAILYGLVMLTVALIGKNYFNITPLYIIGGFIGWKGKKQYTRVKLTKGHTVSLNGDKDDIWLYVLNEYIINLKVEGDRANNLLLVRKVHASTSWDACSVYA